MDSISITNEKFKSHQKAYQYAMDMLKREIYQSAEAMFHRQNCGLIQ